MEPRYNYQPQPQAANSNHIESINAPVTGTPSGHVSRLDEGLGTGHSRDQLLVHWKLAGMSYKEIKAKGRFEEAESTLRGRFRALTKDPGDRVRKPRWTKRDVSTVLYLCYLFFLPLDSNESYLHTSLTD